MKRRVFCFLCAAVFFLPACSVLSLTPFPSATESQTAWVADMVALPTETQTPLVKTTVPAEELPNLVYLWYSVRYDGCPWGGPGSIKAHIRNDGQADAGTFQVVINGYQTSVDGLEKGKETDAVVRFTSGPVGGVTVELDTQEKVRESDESDNAFQIIFTPPPPCETQTP